ncbi:recombination protein RecO [Helicobacter sp. XJK30-2]|uniref:Recombination protein RecO n=1 Tax=Helicobacter zhangjianzhongii TaxID=2974574 RepID=A0ACC6FQZ4_9HELI|nr:recombination protein RecO [Helicobacter sp. XJK30-2]MDL0081527.1 recombination protein RecO [Helicobacter sp. XJK30-2]
MQGYILCVQKQKNEDVIVRILTQTHIATLYRFYGARHPIVHIGRKIDFTKEYNGTFMPKLRNVVHLGFAWERDVTRLYVWQHFIELLHQHLRDISSLEEQYFSILDSSAKRLASQNPKRVVLEAYAQILHLEGRIPPLSHCLICDQLLESEPDHNALESLELGYLSSDTSASLQALQESREATLSTKLDHRAHTCPITPPQHIANIAVLRGFLSAHTACANAATLPYTKLESYLRTASTIDLDDEELERAYQVLLLGL